MTALVATLSLATTQNDEVSNINTDGGVNAWGQDGSVLYPGYTMTEQIGNASSGFGALNGVDEDGNGFVDDIFGVCGALRG